MIPRQLNYLLGIFLLIVVVLEWTASGFLTQGLFDGGYQKPFVATYLTTSSFAVFLLPFLLGHWKSGWGIQRVGYPRPSPRVDYVPLPLDESLGPHSPGVANAPLVVASELLPLSVNPPLTVRETVHLAFVFSFFWFIASWSGGASLLFTSVASFTILGSMSGFFTLGIGRLLGVESFTPWKLGAVFLSTLGVFLVSLEDWAANDTNPSLSRLLFNRSSSTSVSISDASTHPSYSNPMLGDFLALFSGLFYAVWVIYLKVKAEDESRVNMQLFLGFVGAITLALFWPLGIILHYTGVEPFVWPGSNGVWKVLGLKVLLTLSSDYMYPLAMLKTTPLVVTVGISMTIPCAVIGDWTILGVTASGQKLIGATLVVASFIGLGIEGARSGKHHGLQSDGYERLDTRGDSNVENGEGLSASGGR